MRFRYFKEALYSGASLNNFYMRKREKSSSSKLKIVFNKKAKYTKTKSTKDDNNILIEKFFTFISYFLLK